MTRDDEQPDAGADDLPEWLREKPGAAGDINLPDWLDMPEDEDELDLARDRQPPDIAVPRVSPAWVVREPASEDSPLPPSGPANVMLRSRRLLPGIALVAVLIVVILLLGWQLLV